MGEPLSDQILRRISEAAGLYHRLVIVVAPSGAGKTAALQEVANAAGYPSINVNLELSRRLLDLTERQRSLQVPRLLDEIIAEVSGDVVLLDNIEILFDANLKLDPLRCLQRLSRHRTVVVAWNGTAPLPRAQSASHPGVLTYATVGHPEYQRYSAADLVIASPTVS